LYSTLHLTQTVAVDSGYEQTGKPSVTIDDLKSFRQMGSRCAGHPEYRWTTGVETTTGPLGGGVATSVGMAIGEKYLAERYNKPGFEIFNYRIYALCGDGCLMEGISAEAASLAGHLKLDNLCWIYDNNHITIEGPTSVAFTEDVAARFMAYGWNVLKVGDANDVDSVERNLKVAKETKGRPTLVIVDSHIGYGSPNRQDTSAVHGEPLGAAEVKLTKKAYGWPEGRPVPGARRCVRPLQSRHRKARRRRQQSVEGDGRRIRDQVCGSRERDEPDPASRTCRTAGTRTSRCSRPDAKGLAGRDASQKIENAIAKNVPWMIGGSADLAPSTKNAAHLRRRGRFPGGQLRRPQPALRRPRTCHDRDGERPGADQAQSLRSQFMIFSDYARGAIRLSAVMEIPSIHIFTHDSIGVGEDGPTHQPIEHLISLRAIPHLIVLRPGDSNECAEAWRYIMNSTRHPVALILTRQPLPTLDRTKYAAASNTQKGAYVLADADDKKPQVLIMASGSEVSLAVDAHEQLKSEGIKSRVISMPSWELFEHQSQEYKDSVCLPASPRAWRWSRLPRSVGRSILA
jgi:transketolase